MLKYTLDFTKRSTYYQIHIIKEDTGAKTKPVMEYVVIARCKGTKGTSLLVI